MTPLVVLPAVTSALWGMVDQATGEQLTGSGWIGTTEFINATRLTERRVHYWRSHGVFGEPFRRSLESKPGHRAVWAPRSIPPARLLATLSGAVSDLNINILREVVVHFDDGRLELAPGVALTWERIW